jgi:hypothetical protein
VLIGSSVQNGTGQSSSSKTPPSRKEVDHATWNSALEKDFGITPQSFRDMGLQNLTLEQYVNLFGWILQREDDAKKSVPTQTFNCGRPGESFKDAKPEAYEKVRVYVATSGDDDEVFSAVRERLRTMNGVEIVYSSDEADLKLSLVGVKEKEKNIGYQLGNAISIAVAKPCKWQLGTYATKYDTLQDQYVEVGSDISLVVNSIVSAFDTNNLEDERRANAAYRKLLQDSMKK